MTSTALMYELTNFRQLHPENVKQYGWRLKDLVRQYTNVANLDARLVLETFMKGLYPNIQILVRAQQPIDLDTAIALGIQVENSFKYTYELPQNSYGGNHQQNSPIFSPIPWLTPLHANLPPQSTLPPTHVPQTLTMHPQPLALPASSFSQSSSSPLLPSTSQYVPKTTPSYQHLPVPSQSHQTLQNPSHDGYESTASNDIKDMLTNYMNQINENIKSLTIDVNFFKR